MRARLLDRLEQARDARLILVSGPAGYGKTTLLSQWLNNTKQRAAWLSLDPADSEPTRFLRYLIAALQTVLPDVGKSAQALLNAGQLPPPESLLTLVINDLSAVSDPLLLVLDDYHVVDSPSVHTQLAFLVDHMPSSMRLIIATRADPPLPLHRWRARNQLAQVRAADLQFNTAEAAQFIRQATNLNLSSQQVAKLQARTEGWAAGLQMAALSLQAHPDVSGFIQSFSGSQEFILDYLTEEVLSRQPEGNQTFLLQTSILERLSGGLCTAVAERSDAQALLEELAKANAFVSPLDDHRHWFRYHSLFRDLLRARLRRAEPAQWAVLHRRAAQWFEEQGDVHSAVAHADESKDIDYLAHLIEQAALPMLARGEGQTLRTWIEKISSDWVHRCPALCIVQAWALALAGNTTGAEEWLVQAEGQVDASDPRAADLAGQAATIRAQLANQLGDASRAIELTSLAQTLLPEDNRIVRAGTALIRGDAHYARNELNEARQWWQQGAQIGQTSGHLGLAVRGIHGMAIIDRMAGRLRHAGDGFQRALGLARQQGGEHSPLTNGLLLALGELYLQWNELGTARTCAQDALDNADWWKNKLARAHAYALLARIALAESDTASAHAALQKSDRQFPDENTGPIIHAYNQSCWVSLWLALGDIAAASNWACAHDKRSGGARGHSQAMLLVSLARVFLAQGQAKDAVALLAPIVAQAKTSGNVDLGIEALSLQALAMKEESKHSAIDMTETLLTLGQPGGYVRVFLDAGEPMREMLHTWRWASKTQPTRLREYADSLLAAFPRASRPENHQPEGLTARELEVLRLVAQGASNQAVADALVVTTGTVKTHISRIMGKLGAANRTEAVAQARKLGLV